MDSWEQRFQRLWAGGGKKSSDIDWRSRAGCVVWAVLAAVLGSWLLTCIYTVDPSEVGLVKRFGKLIRTSKPGFHLKMPAPIETLIIVDQRSVRTEEIGFRSTNRTPSTEHPGEPGEALMLTGDFNIIHVETVIQYDVSDPVVFAFQVDDSREVLREAAQAVIRERVALRTVDEGLTEKREEIAAEIQEELQDLLDRYGTGIHVINARLQEVTPPTKGVAAAFDDVNSAVQDKERMIFEAQRYANEQLPKAEGKSQEILNQAEGYKQSRILKAEGESARFLSVLQRYNQGKTVTEAQLYLETMEKVLPNVRKIILPRDAGPLNLLNLQMGDFKTIPAPAAPEVTP